MKKILKVDTSSSQSNLASNQARQEKGLQSKESSRMPGAGIHSSFALLSPTLRHENVRVGDVSSWAGFLFVCVHINRLCLGSRQFHFLCSS